MLRGKSQGAQGGEMEQAWMQKPKDLEGEENLKDKGTANKKWMLIWETLETLIPPDDFLAVISEPEKIEYDISKNSYTYYPKRAPVVVTN